jgi:hypothetical protein
MKIRSLGLEFFHFYTNTYVIFIRDKDVWFAVSIILSSEYVTSFHAS